MFYLHLSRTGVRISPPPLEFLHALWGADTQDAQSITQYYFYCSDKVKASCGKIVVICYDPARGIKLVKLCRHMMEVICDSLGFHII